MWLSFIEELVQLERPSLVQEEFLLDLIRGLPIPNDETLQEAEALLVSILNEDSYKLLSNVIIVFYILHLKLINKDLSKHKYIANNEVTDLLWILARHTNNTIQVLAFLTLESLIGKMYFEHFLAPAVSIPFIIHLKKVVESADPQISLIAQNSIQTTFKNPKIPAAPKVTSRLYIPLKNSLKVSNNGLLARNDSLQTQKISITSATVSKGKWLYEVEIYVVENLVLGWENEKGKGAICPKNAPLDVENKCKVGCYLSIEEGSATFTINSQPLEKIPFSGTSFCPVVYLAPFQQICINFDTPESLIPGYLPLCSL